MLQILKGSHKAGRINHVKVGDQVGADVERVEMLMKVCTFIYIYIYIVIIILMTGFTSC